MEDTMSSCSSVDKVLYEMAYWWRKRCRPVALWIKHSFPADPPRRTAPAPAPASSPSDPDTTSRSQNSQLQSVYYYPNSPTEISHRKRFGWLCRADRVHSWWCLWRTCTRCWFGGRWRWCGCHCGATCSGRGTLNTRGSMGCLCRTSLQTNHPRTNHYCGNLDDHNFLVR